MYQRILLAVDGSHTSDAALREAAKLAQDGAQLYVMTITEDPYLLYKTLYKMDVTALHDAIIALGRSVLDDAQKQLTELGVKAEMQLVDMSETACFSIPETILKYADTCQADLIVLGTHGREGSKRFFMGSVAEHVMRTSAKPVLLVRDPQSAAALDSPEE